jgi:hypothetical protein
MTDKKDLQRNIVRNKAIIHVIELEVLSFEFLQTSSFALYHQSFA